jgi:hypothetical protein
MTGEFVDQRMLKKASSHPPIPKCAETHFRPCFVLVLLNAEIVTEVFNRLLKLE